MIKSYRAILIDPRNHRIEVVESDGSHQSLCELIGTRGLDHFRIAEDETRWDYGWVDDTGLHQKQVHAFKFENRRNPVAGRCVLIGVNKETGDTTDALFPISILRESVEWLGMIRPEVTWDEPTPGHQRAIITYARVK